MVGAKTQVQGDFRRKCKESNCPVHQTESYLSFSNAAEAAIRELKKMIRRALNSSRSPKKLWDHCMELQSFVKSHTALDMWQLKGQIPQTLMTGQTADKSQFFELEWYEWVMFHDPAAIEFPEDKLILGKWLGPLIDIGLAMTGKILKSNRNTRHVSTYRSLTKEEEEDPQIQQQIK